MAPHYIVALKCMYKDELVASKVEKQVRREIEIQSNLRSVPSLVSPSLHELTSVAFLTGPSRHPNILRLYGFFHDEKRIFLMLEFAGKGELYKQLSKLRSFSEKRSSRVRLAPRSRGVLHRCPR